MVATLALKQGKNDYESFNESLGITIEDWKKAEAWQILSPVRAEAFGTSKLNCIVQSKYRAA